MNILSRPPALPTAAAESPHDLVRTGDIERLRMGNFTPLHEAPHRDSLEAVQALLEIGADPSRRTWLTPVDWAQGRSVIKAVVAAGADPDARCPEETGNAPLHRRVCMSLPQPISALLDAGADVSARDV